VKFLDSAPFAVYRQHWIDNLPGDLRKHSYVCWDRDCPLCDIGDTPSVMAVFNVVVLDPDEPINAIWVTRPTLATQLVDLDGDARKGGPLTKHYWSVSRSGKGPKTSYNVQVVKERDLPEDWMTEPLSEEELDEYSESAFDVESAVNMTPRKTLREIADALTAEDD
jgi:hypothetical protein